MLSLLLEIVWTRGVFKFAAWVLQKTHCKWAGSFVGHVDRMPEEFGYRIKQVQPSRAVTARHSA